MTTVEIVFRYITDPTDQVAMALADTREVYGIRRLTFDRTAKTLHVEYDATRLNSATVAQLVRHTGLDIEEDAPATPSLPAAEPTTTA